MHTALSSVSVTVRSKLPATSTISMSSLWRKPRLFTLATILFAFPSCSLSPVFAALRLPPTLSCLPNRCVESIVSYIEAVSTNLPLTYCLKLLPSTHQPCSLKLVTRTASRFSSRSDLVLSTSYSRSRLYSLSIPVRVTLLSHVGYITDKLHSWPPHITPFHLPADGVDTISRRPLLLD
jgi:hypothetical protein